MNVWRGIGGACLPIRSQLPCTARSCGGGPFVERQLLAQAEVEIRVMQGREDGARRVDEVYMEIEVVLVGEDTLD